MEQTITSTTTKGLVIGLILIILALATYFANIEGSMVPYNGLAMPFLLVVLYGQYIPMVNR